jgi:hypothetical protein
MKLIKTSRCSDQRISRSRMSPSFASLASRDVKRLTEARSPKRRRMVTEVVLVKMKKIKTKVKWRWFQKSLL